MYAWVVRLIGVYIYAFWAERGKGNTFRNPAATTSYGAKAKRAVSTARISLFRLWSSRNRRHFPPRPLRRCALLLFHHLKNISNFILKIPHLDVSLLVLAHCFRLVFTLEWILIAHTGFVYYVTNHEANAESKHRGRHRQRERKASDRSKISSLAEFRM